jgi:hypothetical protein
VLTNLLPYFCRFYRMENEQASVRIVVGAFILLVSIFITTVYLLSARENGLLWPDIYISHATNTDPGRAIGAYMIPMIVMTVIFVIKLRLLRMREHIRGETRLKRYFFILAWMSLVGMFLGLVGAAAVPISTNEWLHWISAVIGFTCGILLLVLLTMLDDKLNFIRPWWIKWTRLLLLAIIVMCALVGIILSFIVEGPSAILELIAVAAFGIFFLTYDHSSEFPLRRCDRG